MNTDRVWLACIVLFVLVSQVFLYPGLEELITALGVSTDLQAGMWFLVAEFAAFVAFAVFWGIVSDVTGKRVPWIVLGSLGGAVSYLLLIILAQYSIPFAAILTIRVAGGAFIIAAFSLSITMLMDLSGGNGRNMGAAGIAIGLGAATGSVIGGQLTGISPLAPLFGGAILLVGSAVIAVQLQETTSSKRVSISEVVSQTRDYTTLPIPYAFGFIDRLTAGFFSLVGVWYFRDVFNVDAGTAGMTLALFFFPFAILQYPFGTLSDHVGRFIPVVVGSLSYGVCIILIAFAPTYHTAAGLMVLLGVTGAFMAPSTMALVTDIVSPSEHGTAMGGFNIFGSLGFLTGFLVGGSVVAAANYQTAFLVVGGLELLIALVASNAVRKI